MSDLKLGGSFNVGDFVKCTYDFIRLTNGKSYEIIRMIGLNRIVIINDKCKTEAYFDFYFELDKGAFRDNVINKILE